LEDLDKWIQQQVARIPPQRRMIVTNHESFGYFADRYGFRIIGTIVPSISSNASPSSQQFAQLIDQIKSTGVTAVFLETGTNPQLAEQIAQETGVKVVADLYTHSISPMDEPANSYMNMMRYNVNRILEALQ
jgi:ABC-type Zn uptake system ZnuABC Zn-binding protein ZnuA